MQVGARFNPYGRSAPEAMAIPCNGCGPAFIINRA